MKYILIPLLICFSLSLSGQQEESTEQVRYCRVLFLNKPADAPDYAFIFDGKDTSHKVGLSSMNFSRVVELPGGPLTIGLSAEEVVVPEEFPKGAPKLKIPEGVNDIYLLLTSDPSNQALPVRIRPLNVDDSKLQAGETLWINLSPHNVAAQFGEKQVMIPAMKQTVSPPPLENSGYYLAKFIYQKNGEGRYWPVMKKSWWFDASSKRLGFILDTGGRLPKIFSFRDSRTAPERSSEDDVSEGADI